MGKVKPLLFAGWAILILAGCAKEQQFKAAGPICVPGMNKPAAMRAAKEVLGEMHFTIDKADTERGLIRSRPLAAAQFFEFWRSDNVGAFNTIEANLHSIRRTTELAISRQGQQLCIGCDVDVQRLSLPEREVTSGAQAYGMFTTSDRAIQTLKLHPEQKIDMAWVDLGQDARLAAQILKRIGEKLKAESKK